MHSLKRLIIIFLIFALLPVFWGKVKPPPFSDFFKSWESFKASGKELIAADFQYYKNLITPWAEKLVNFVKEEIKKLPIPFGK